jgi:hypothetical protein
MKTLQLRQWNDVVIKVRDNSGFIADKKIEMNTQTLIRQCVDNIPDGITTTEMIKRIKIVEKLEKLKPGTKTIDFEDDEYNVLIDCENKIKWSLIHKCFIEFHEDIKKALK